MRGQKDLLEVQPSWKGVDQVDNIQNHDCKFLSYCPCMVFTPSYAWTPSSARTLSGSKAKLTCAKFSSVDMSGKHPLWLAVGTDDGCIHTFRFKECQVGWLFPN